jgi:hypothetical protein
MQDDPSLNDEQLEHEIRLVGDLVLAASQSEGPLSDEALDAILGSSGADGARVDEPVSVAPDELPPAARAG